MMSELLELCEDYINTRVDKVSFKSRQIRLSIL